MQKLGDRLNVPVGFRHVDVTEVGGKPRHEPIDVDAVAVPLDEPPGRERVAEVLQPRATTAAATTQARAQTDGLAERCKRAASGARTEAGSPPCDEERRRVAAGPNRVAELGVGCQGSAGGLFEGTRARHVERFFQSSEHPHAAIAAAYGDATHAMQFRYATLRDTLRDEADGAAKAIRTLSVLANVVAFKPKPEPRPKRSRAASR